MKANGLPTILDYEQYILLYKVSYIHLLSSIYGYVYQSNHVALFNLATSLTSINYWYLPLDNWRRYIDIIVANSNMIYYLYLANQSIYGYYYYLIILCLVLSYVAGNYYYIWKKDYWTSTFLHLLVHIYGFMGNIILFSGNPL